MTRKIKIALVIQIVLWFIGMVINYKIDGNVIIGGLIGNYFGLIYSIRVISKN